MCATWNESHTDTRNRAAPSGLLLHSHQVLLTIWTLFHFDVLLSLSYPPLWLEDFDLTIPQGCAQIAPEVASANPATKLGVLDNSSVNLIANRQPGIL